MGLEETLASNQITAQDVRCRSLPPQDNKLNTNRAAVMTPWQAAATVQMIQVTASEQPLPLTRSVVLTVGSQAIIITIIIVSKLNMLRLQDSRKMYEEHRL